MKINRRIVFLFAGGMVAALCAGMLLFSCSGGGGGGSGQSGTVALYITDDMAGYRQVTATINTISLLNTGSSNSCTVFTGPQTFDITNLAGVMQLINVTSCPVVPYNRIHIEFAKNVTLMDLAGNTSPCQFVSYMDAHNKPNALSCGADSCTLDVNGAVNVLVNKQNKLALDFDLKNFDVLNFGNPATCSVTMKVSPLHAGDMEALKHPEAITGLVSGLSTTNKTFTLTRGYASFNVLYSGITTSRQPGIDTLLQRAQDDRLRVRVLAPQIDLANHTITATALFVKVEGTIAAGSLNTTNHTFTVNYGSGTSIAVDYSAAIVDGVLSEGGWVGVKLYGFDGTDFLAQRVEVEADGTTTDD
jgi:hypothetical protein